MLYIFLEIKIIKGMNSNFLFTHFTSHHYLAFGRIVLTGRSTNTTSDYPNTQRLHPIVGGQYQVQSDGGFLKKLSGTELQWSREKPCVAVVLWNDKRTKQPAQES